MNGDPVLIAGGGIGGLTAALCLAQQGFPVMLLEQAAAFGDIGAGLQLSPNATRVLASLGLAEDLARIGFLPEGVEIRHWQQGKVLSYAPLGTDALRRYGYPYYHVHRADLIDLLAAAARRDPLIELHNDACVERLTTTGEGVSVHTEDGDFRGCLVVGADGIHSKVREALFGEQPPRFTGNVAWRALIPTAALPPGLVRPMATVWWGPGRHFVHYFVRGGEMVNCVCVVEKPGWEVESWSARGELAELQRDFSGWHETVSTLVDHIDPTACYKWALFDRSPLSSWHRGRATLLGDACHPTLPFLAQGAAMAIEDAAVLARCLSAAVDTGQALARYEALRKPRTSAIQAGSRRNARVFHMRGLQAWARNLVAERASGRVLQSIYAYDALRAGGFDGQ